MIQHPSAPSGSSRPACGEGGLGTGQGLPREGHRLEGRKGAVGLDELEHRPERPYDDVDPSRILHPNGTRMVCGSRPLTAALVRAVREVSA